MSKRVRIMLEMDEHFVRLLKAACTMKNLGNLRTDSKQHSPPETLAIVTLLEAMGASEEQVHAETPPEWRPHLSAIHDSRKVIEEERPAHGRHTRKSGPPLEKHTKKPSKKSRRKAVIEDADIYLLPKM